VVINDCKAHVVAKCPLIYTPNLDQVSLTRGVRGEAKYGLRGRK
jgi:hypothetical protein